MKTVFIILLLSFSVFAQQYVPILKTARVVTPTTINYMITLDSDTMFTADSDTMKTAFNFEQNNKKENEEIFIIPNRVFAVLNKRTSTMDINS